jgi:uncharacterized protein (DUF4415 family)
MKKEYDSSGGKRGPVLDSTGKTRVTMYLDNDVLEAFRSKAEAAGKGYQTLINESLREYLHEGEAVNAKTLRKILREELKRTGT